MPAAKQQRAAAKRLRKSKRGPGFSKHLDVGAKRMRWNERRVAYSARLRSWRQQRKNEKQRRKQLAEIHAAINEDQKRVDARNAESANSARDRSQSMVIKRRHRRNAY